jgi:hypothetical protein
MKKRGKGGNTAQEDKAVKSIQPCVSNSNIVVIKKVETSCLGLSVVREERRIRTFIPISLCFKLHLLFTTIETKPHKFKDYGLLGYNAV